LLLGSPLRFVPGGAPAPANNSLGYNEAEVDARSVFITKRSYGIDAAQKTNAL
jgi:hypothetical protein